MGALEATRGRAQLLSWPTWNLRVLATPGQSCLDTPDPQGKAAHPPRLGQCVGFRAPAQASLAPVCLPHCSQEEEPGWGQACLGRPRELRPEKARRPGAARRSAAQASGRMAWDRSSVRPIRPCAELLQPCTAGFDTRVSCGDSKELPGRAERVKASWPLTQGPGGPRTEKAPHRPWVPQCYEGLQKPEGLQSWSPRTTARQSGLEDSEQGLSGGATAHARLSRGAWRVGNGLHSVLKSPGALLALDGGAAWSIESRVVSASGSGSAAPKCSEGLRALLHPWWPLCPLAVSFLYATSSPNAPKTRPLLLYSVPKSGVPFQSLDLPKQGLLPRQPHTSPQLLLSLC